jgi:hypothetical protein
VNPKHLFLGTNADNMADMVRKGRAAGVRRRAMAHPLARNVDENEIVRLAAVGTPQRSIAAALGVSQSLVSGVVNGNRWTHT